MNPLLILLAGPNGAGKSTFFDLHLARYGIPFINADRIALETFGNQEPETSIPSAQLAETLRREMLNEGRSFISETVLSDPKGAKVAFLAQARAAGFFVDCHFIGIASPALSLARVIHRVENGGHDVPDDKIAARFPRVMENLRRVIPVASRLTIYDNSETARPHRPIAVFEDGKLISLSSEIPNWLQFLDLPALATSSTTPLP